MKKQLYIYITLLIVILDQATKYLADRFISPFDTLEILPFLNLVHVRNKGAAFGILSNIGNTAFIFISLAAVIVIFIMLIKGKEDRLSLSLILGGAVGNLIDRIFRGFVVDFVDIFVGRYHWPAFNVADSALTVGIGLIFIRLFISSREKT